MGHHIYVWPLGQAVKTPPFHGGNRGSIPLGVTRNTGFRYWVMGIRIMRKIFGVFKI